MVFFARCSALCLALLPAIAQCGSSVATMPPHAQDLFNQSMSWMDEYWDPSAAYLYDVSEATALRHETRSSAWYAVGLLARNNGSDVDSSMRIITNVIHGQYKNPAQQWYADYQQEPEEPTVGTSQYPPKIYNSWDANWRGFIGTAFVVALEEFGHLITPKVTKLLLESLHNATIGDSYRVGGLDGDNLYPVYSNPSLMRAFVSGWTGRRLNDSNMTAAGEMYASEVIALFNRANTLSEFNSGTYTGISLWALTLWSKYLPETSVMKQNGPKMLQYTWEAASQLYHPELKNIAGPWDRSYGFDMTRYLSIMALHIWSILGKDKSGLIDKTYAMSHSADWAFGPLIAIVSDFANTLIPKTAVDAFSSFIGEHTFNSSCYSPPYDTYPRNITAWLAPNISIGAETFSESVIGGPAENVDTFNPAVIQWQTGDGIGWITLHPSEQAITAVASPGLLYLTYPLGNASSIFSLLISPFYNSPWTGKKDLKTWDDVLGLSVNVSGNVNSTYALSYAGAYGGADATINDFEFWNITYSMPANSTDIPHLQLEVALK